MEPRHRLFELVTKQCFNYPDLHMLHRFTTPRASFSCDLCDLSQSPGAIMFGCRFCNWDLCKACNDWLESDFMHLAPSNNNDNLLAKRIKQDVPRLAIRRALQRLLRDDNSVAEQRTCCNEIVNKAVRVAYVTQSPMFILCVGKQLPKRAGRIMRMFPMELIRMLAGMLGPEAALGVDDNNHSNGDDDINDDPVFFILDEM